MSWLINVVGLAAIAGVLWWFWLGKRGTAAGKSVGVSDSVIILVKNGVYEPERLEIPAGLAAKLYFRREDPSPCAEYVVFANLDVSQQLILHQETMVQLPALETGEYPFHCQMKMYRGTLVVT